MESRRSQGIRWLSFLGFGSPEAGRSRQPKTVREESRRDRRSDRPAHRATNHPPEQPSDRAPNNPPANRPPERPRNRAPEQPSSDRAPDRPRNRPKHRAPHRAPERPSDRPPQQPEDRTRQRPNQRPRFGLDRRRRTDRPNAPTRPSSAAKPAKSPFSSRFTQQSLDLHPFRLIVTWFFLIAALGGMSYRLYVLQVKEATNLLERAENQQYIQLKPVLPRRTIVDRNDRAIALDQVRYTLYVHPILFTTELATVAAELAPLLTPIDPKLTESELLAEFSAQETGIRLADNVTEETATAIRRLSIDGLDLEKYQERFYPSGSLFSQLVGYVDWEGTAQNGLEATQSALLLRSKPDLTVRRMGNGLVLPEALDLDVLQEDDLRLQLTLDSRIQQAAQSILQAQLDKFSAKRGAVIVMEVNTGEIITLATLPTYDSNRYYDADVANFRNWALSDLYEPGSTFKPLNVAIALELGGITATDSIYDEGQIQVSGWPIANHDFETRGGHGTLSITEVLKYSSNVGMVHIVQTLNPGKYYESLQHLGLGEPMQTDLPQVATGYLKEREVMLNSAVDRATTSFGQGITVTPLQMVQLHGALANGGKQVTPHVIKGLVDSNNQFHWTPQYETEQVFKPEIARQVLDMMEAVVRDGTESAQIPGYRIGGKTGTAQKAENGVYIAGAKVTSFVGIVPIEAPRYVVFAVIDEPQGANTFGSTVAAPVVREVMETLTLLYGIKPSDPALANQKGNPGVETTAANPRH